MPLKPITKGPTPSPLYDADFHRWAEEQGRAIREKRLADIDWGNVAEEIETLGRSERQQILSRLSVLLLHLLKWQFQPDSRSGSWRGSIVEQRYRLAQLLEENPSLRDYPSHSLAGEYDVARLKAAGETGLPEDIFPAACPYTIAEILDPAFLPDSATG